MPAGNDVLGLAAAVDLNDGALGRQRVVRGPSGYGVSGRAPQLLDPPDNIRVDF